MLIIWLWIGSQLWVYMLVPQKYGHKIRSLQCVCAKTSTGLQCTQIFLHYSNILMYLVSNCKHSICHPVSRDNYVDLLNATQKLKRCAPVLLLGVNLSLVCVLYSCFCAAFANEDSHGMYHFSVLNKPLFIAWIHHKYQWNRQSSI